MFGRTTCTLVQTLVENASAVGQFDRSRILAHVVECDECEAYLDKSVDFDVLLTLARSLGNPVDLRSVDVLSGDAERDRAQRVHSAVVDQLLPSLPLPASRQVDGLPPGILLEAIEAVSLLVSEALADLEPGVQAAFLREDGSVKVGDQMFPPPLVAREIAQFTQRWMRTEVGPGSTASSLARWLYQAASQQPLLFPDLWVDIEFRGPNWLALGLVPTAERVEDECTRWRMGLELSSGNAEPAVVATDTSLRSHLVYGITDVLSVADKSVLWGDDFRSGVVHIEALRVERTELDRAIRAGSFPSIIKNGIYQMPIQTHSFQRGSIVLEGLDGQYAQLLAGRAFTPRDKTVDLMSRLGLLSAA